MAGDAAGVLLERHAEAGALDEALEDAARGAGHGLAATLPDGDEGLAVLAEARGAARSAGTPTVQARAALGEGAMLRRLGRRADARPVLREALDLAARTGAHGLAAGARDELAAAGARARERAVTGPAALTPSEARIATMAAEGDSNVSIARALFVTEKTVETHLTSTYRKLGISSRRHLRDTLRSPG